MRPLFWCGPLEPRLLLTTPIYGSPGDDTFIINVTSDKRIHLIYNGVTDVLQDEIGSDLVEVFLGAGNDTVTLQNTDFLTFDLYDDGGNDHYRLGNGRVETDIRRHITIYDSGDGIPVPGNDSIIIDDSVGDSSGTAWVLGGSTATILGLTFDPTIAIGLAGDATVSIQGGTGPDHIYLNSLRRNLTVTMGDGNDTLDVGGTDARVDYFLPPGIPVSIDGGGQSNRINVNNSNTASTQNDLLIDDDRLLNAIKTRNFNSMTINTRNGPSSGPLQTVRFTGRRPAIEQGSITITGSAGPERVLFEPTEGITNYVGEEVTFRLGTGESEVVINDPSGISGRSWVFNGSTLAVNGTTFFTSLTHIRLRIFAGDRDDPFLVNSIDPDWLVHINGGLGKDSLTHAGGDLDAVFGNTFVEFNGGAELDAVVLSDYLDQVGDVDEYIINGQGVSKADQGTAQDYMVLYQNVEDLTVIADADPNVIYYSGLNVISRVNVDARGGNDVFTNVTPGSTGANLQSNMGTLAILNGGSGTNTLFIDDKSGGANDYELTSAHFSLLGGFSRRLEYAAIATLEINANNSANDLFIRSKPAGMMLTVNALGGNDDLTVGGGDIDSNGFLVSNTSLSGGADEDSMRFDDRLDTDPGSEAETYLQTALASQNKLSKGLYGATYFTVESLTIDLADATVGGANTVDLRSFSTPITAVTLNGGSARYNAINLANGDLNVVLGPTFTFNMSGGASDALTVFNQGATATNVYSFEANKLVRTALPNQQITINHAGLEEIDVRAGSNYDYFYLMASAPGSFITARGNGGNDAFWIDQSWADIHGASAFLGGPGLDHFISTHNFGAAAYGEVVTDTGVSMNGSAAQSYYECEQLTANTAGTGGGTIVVKSLSLPTEMSATGGGVNLAIGDGNLDANIRASLNVNFGFSGDCSITYDDRLDTGNDSYHFQPDLTFFKLKAVTGVMSPVITGGGIYGNGTQTLLANNSDNTISCNTIVGDLRIFANGGNDTVNLFRGSVTVDTGAEALTGAGDAIVVNPDFDLRNDVPATARLAGDDRIASVQVRPGGTLEIGAGTTLEVTSQLLVQGRIDLGGALLSRATVSAAPNFAALLTSGRGTGGWNGTQGDGSAAATAIVSTRAAASPVGDGLGYGAAAQIGVTSIDGRTINAGDTLIRHTLDGDADLNGLVNFSDLVRLAQNYNQTNRGWAQGDFTYNGTTAFEDLVRLAQNYNASAPALSASILMSSAAQTSAKNATRARPSRSVLDSAAP